MKAAVAAVAFGVSEAVYVGDVGDRMIRTYTKYVKLPITEVEAKTAGWVSDSPSCTEFGLPFSLKGSQGFNGSEDNPTTLYYTPTGELSGISVDVFWAPPPQNLIDAGYFTKLGDKHYRLGVAFRANPCLNQTQHHIIGDRVVIQPNAVNRSLPLNLSQAVAEGWTKGSCFSGMGTHYFFDLATHPKMSWQAANVLPVVIMFNNNHDLQAIFFASWENQVQISGAHGWEPIPLINPLMCKNMCDKECTFNGTHAWSTYHVYFRDLSVATCNNGCTIGCCK